MKKPKIRLKLSSYDHRLLDKAVKQIVMAAKKTGAQLMGPVPLPNRGQVFTVLTSPHVDKKAREQFDLIKHHRLLEIFSPSEKTMDELMKLNLSSSVEVQIK